MVLFFIKKNVKKKNPCLPYLFFSNMLPKTHIIFYLASDAVFCGSWSGSTLFIQACKSEYVERKYGNFDPPRPSEIVLGLPMRLAVCAHAQVLCPALGFFCSETVVFPTVRPTFVQKAEKVFRYRVPCVPCGSPRGKTNLVPYLNIDKERYHYACMRNLVTVYPYTRTL